VQPRRVRQGLDVHRYHPRQRSQQPGRRQGSLSEGSDEGLRRFPSDARLHHLNGIPLAATGKLEQAIQATQQSIELYAHDERPHIDLANIYYHQKKVKEGRAFDAAGNNTTSIAIPVTVNNTTAMAVYDSALQAPKCASVASACDTGASLVLGRANLGPEPNQPNTINDSCLDGTSGTFHSDESVDQVTVTSVDGTNFATGKQVRVDVKVWAYSSFTSDAMDIYYAANASSPSWTLVGTIVPTAGGAQTLSATYTLPSGSLQAVRAAFRYSGTASPCTTGSYDDRDDLVFAVGAGAPDTTPPTVSLTAPANGATVSGTVTLSANASDNVGVTSVEFLVNGSVVGTDTTSPYSVSWNSTTVLNGTHTVTARAHDAAGNSTTSSAATITVNNTTGGELVVNGGFEGSTSPWVLTNTVASSVIWSTANPRSGSRVMHLGNVNNANGTLYQTVSIPSTATANYTFWLNVTSNETTTSIVYDRLYVEVRNTSGTLLTTLATYSNLNKGTLGVYSQKSFSLAAYRGQTVRLQFRTTSDSSLTTTFRVDDVSLQ
jgi:hypothetical protein